MSADLAPWLDRVIVGPDGVPHRVLSVGVTLQLDNEKHVPLGLVLNPDAADWHYYEKVAKP